MDIDIGAYAFFKELTRQPTVDAIWLFGSRARGDHGDRSDIDLAIVCPRATDGDWRKIMDIIENADTLYKIDCVRFEKEKISQDLYEAISTQGTVLYDKKQHQA